MADDPETDLDLRLITSSPQHLQSGSARPFLPEGQEGRFSDPRRSLYDDQGALGAGRGPINPTTDQLDFGITGKQGVSHSCQATLPKK